MEKCFQPDSEAKVARIGVRSVPRVFLFLAIALGLTGSLCLPSEGYPQATKINPDDVDTGKVQPLDLKPGCWEVRIESLSWVAATPQEMSPQQISLMEKAMTPEQLTQFKAVLETLQEGYQKNGKQAGENGQKALSSPVGGGQQMACTPAPFVANGVEVYGSQTQQCERSVVESTGVRRMHVLCRGPEGTPTLYVDYQRIDDGYFTGTRVGVVDSWPSIVSFAGKWIGEASPHMPHSPPPTDLDGKRLPGPQAVAGMDGFRVVAMAEGKQILAANAFAMLGGVLEPAKTYGPDLANQFQQIYLHWSVANEATSMNLGLQEPWHSQLLAAYGQFWKEPGYPTYSSSAALTGNKIDDQRAETARERIHWDAYFSQAKTEEEKQALLRKVQEKYKVTVIDPDFFNGQTSP